ncbi:MAG: ABC transporter substrate-binding protein [Burkholderiales bacterium]|nr:ABC transporter substrate-binding protein [Burkholderiales bacterium]
MNRVPRRRFLLAGAALAAARAAGVRAQANKPLRIIWFSAGTPERNKPYVEAFRDGLRERGYRENENVVIDYYWRGETLKTYNWMASDIVGEKPDVIVATCEISAKAAKEATDSIPIVLAASTDPVAHGLINSLAHPGTNLTGLSFNEIEIGAKRIELLREVVPGLRRVGTITREGESMSDVELKRLQEMVEARNYELVGYRLRDDADFAAAFEAMRAAKVDGILDYSSLSVTFPYREKFTALALESRIPVAYHLREMVEAGGLMSYGPVAPASFHRAAYYVDRIAKGARAAELPVEQPTRFELAVNLKTARALGIEFPQSILLRADTVIA